MPVEGALVVEDDRFLRVLGIVLDPGTSRGKSPPTWARTRWQ